MRIRIPNTDTNRNFLPHVSFPLVRENSGMILCAELIVHHLWRSWRTWWNTKRRGTSPIIGTSKSWARTSWTTRWVRIEFLGSVVDPHESAVFWDPGSGSYKNPDVHPRQIKFRIRIRIKVIRWIRIRVNLQMTSQNVWNMSLFEHFSRVWPLIGRS